MKRIALVAAVLASGCGEEPARNVKHARHAEPDIADDDDEPAANWWCAEFAEKDTGNCERSRKACLEYRAGLEVTAPNATVTPCTKRIAVACFIKKHNGISFPNCSRTMAQCQNFRDYLINNRADTEEVTSECAPSQ